VKGWNGCYTVHLNELVTTDFNAQMSGIKFGRAMQIYALFTKKQFYEIGIEWLLAFWTLSIGKTDFD
jgi:hypothetical protein